MSYLYSG